MRNQILILAAGKGTRMGTDRPKVLVQFKQRPLILHLLEQVEKMCSHLVVLKRGSVVASGPIGEMQAGFAGHSLEAGFMQLTEQVDAEAIAQNIAAAALLH